MHINYYTFYGYYLPCYLQTYFGTNFIIFKVMENEIILLLTDLPLFLYVIRISYLNTYIRSACPRHKLFDKMFYEIVK